MVPACHGLVCFFLTGQCGGDFFLKGFVLDFCVCLNLCKG